MKSARDWSVVRTAQGWRIRGPNPRTANRFLARVGLRGLAAGSLRTYAFDLLRILRWVRRRRKRLEHLCREDLYRFVRDQRGRLQAVTVNRHLRLLYRLQLFLHPDDAQGQPFRGRRSRVPSLPYVKEPRTVKRPLTDRQVRSMAQALRTNRDRAIVGLMWAAGLRIGEVLALRQEDIDWEQAALHVCGKGNRERSLPLAESVAGLIRRYQAVERPPTGTPAVFVVLKGPRRGQRLTYAGIRRIFRYHRQRLKMPQAHPHRFRHTFAVNMIRQGMSVPSLMRLMGHTWPETTLRYVHFDDHEVREHYEQALAKLAQTGRRDAAADLRAIL
jgi:site-specific recombinase XerD